MIGSIKYLLFSVFIIFYHFDLIGICAYSPNNLIEYLHERKNTIIFQARIDSTWITERGAYVSRATVIDIFLGKIDSKQVLIYSGYNDMFCPGGTLPKRLKMYLFVSREFEPDCFSALVCDNHSRIIDNSEESKNLLDLVSKIRQVYSKKLNGGVDFFLGSRKLASGKYKYGKPNGNWKFYDKEFGFLSLEIHYTKGIKTGVEKRYNQYGMHIWSRYDRDGSLLEIKNYKGKNILHQHSFYKIPIEDFIVNKYINYGNNEFATDTVMELGVKGLEVASKYHGRYVEYNDDGELIARGNYCRGAKIGLWYRKGRSSNEAGKYITYSPNLKEYDGCFYWYNEDGSLGTMFVPTRGQWSGKMTTGSMIGFKTNGDTSFMYQYIDGKKSGESISYYGNVNLIHSITNYNNNEIEGEYTYFHASPHVVAAHGFYLNGMNKKGLWEFFYPNGQLEAYEFYNDEGKLSGKRMGFYPNGQLKDSVNYINGVKEGLYTAYFDNGNIKESGRYEGGHKTGEWLFFNEDKTIQKTLIFEKN